MGCTLSWNKLFRYVTVFSHPFALFRYNSLVLAMPPGGGAASDNNAPNSHLQKQDYSEFSVEEIELLRQFVLGTRT